MTKTTGNICFFIAALVSLLVSGSGAGAQELPPPPDQSGLAETIASPEVSNDLIGPGIPDGLDPLEPIPGDYSLYQSAPPLPESSGTWLNQGLWYSQVEAVVMTRVWESGGGIILFRDGNTNQVSPITGADILNSNRRLTLSRSSPGREGSARFTIGRFLFRDCANRDHNLEFTVLGAGEFGQNSEIFTNDPLDPFDEVDAQRTLFTLEHPNAIDLDAIISFDGAESSFVQYDSRFNTFELNYIASSRLQRDQMVLLPGGDWIRRANSGYTFQFLAGLRYFDLTENLDWTANNITNDLDGDGALQEEDIDGERGQYLIRTSNDVFGPQLGVGATYATGRFSVGGLSKFGLLANDQKTSSAVTFVDPSSGEVREDISFSNANRADTLSFITEFSLVGRYHMRPNLSLRAGYHMLYATEVALAPHQIDFSPDDSKVATSGDSFYHGLSTGLDFYW